MFQVPVQPVQLTVAVAPAEASDAPLEFSPEVELAVHAIFSGESQIENIIEPIVWPLVDVLNDVVYVTAVAAGADVDTDVLLVVNWPTAMAGVDTSVIPTIETKPTHEAAFFHSWM